MKSDFSRFLHHTLSRSGIRGVSAPSLSHSGLTGVSRWSKFATWFDLDHRVKPDGDRKGKDASLKPDGDSLCAGRSMVEMLGVLAIIGVLSVGAIAGYSKAMMKYKLNKQAEQMNTVINAVARNVHSFDNLLANKGAFNLTNTFVKMGEIPVEMHYNNHFIRDVFNNYWTITLLNYDSGITLNLVFAATSALKNKSANNLEICRNIITVAKENSDSIEAVSNVIFNQDSNDYTATFLYGDAYCLSGRPCLKNLHLDDIYNFCTKFTGGDKVPQFKISWGIK